mmetsp:Transcript_1756/g.3450  ORF Transcript_1756/g.3450 Transcript_1756/m.3450 type:complete len:145 (-) Transcript_1756:144-578(-)|eukprot:CAMPEP_0202690436 /NCGR_PEP_ID=MMETSP1385-20130828/5422_1 /ASSEMBLY_ACC=CAM_ASM_000861 /TAXON_ID=933848 /ORGANISM="Elphidium margaritaceum" /LENGTH=144 /DNA_ID=CAMNT_0049345699 /DNA_START=58 /DNA_END=492 /DNA_ORIENTATION=-
MAAAATSTAFPRIISHNLLTGSAFLSYSRLVAFGFGYLYANAKLAYLSGYVESENEKKFAQIREAEISANTLRGVTFHAPQVWDPEYTELQMRFRDCYPDFYLHPNDEFVYQLTRGKQKDQKVKEELHAEAVAFLKEWKSSEGK